MVGILPELLRDQFWINSQTLLKNIDETKRVKYNQFIESIIDDIINNEKPISLSTIITELKKYTNNRIKNFILLVCRNHTDHYARTILEDMQSHITRGPIARVESSEVTNGKRLTAKALQTHLNSNPNTTIPYQTARLLKANTYKIPCGEEVQLFTIQQLKKRLDINFIEPEEYKTIIQLHNINKKIMGTDLGSVVDLQRDLNEKLDTLQETLTEEIRRDIKEGITRKMKESQIPISLEHSVNWNLVPRPYVRTDSMDSMDSTEVLLGKNPTITPQRKKTLNSYSNETLSGGSRKKRKRKRKRTRKKNKKYKKNKNILYNGTKKYTRSSK